MRIMFLALPAKLDGVGRISSQVFIALELLRRKTRQGKEIARFKRKETRRNDMPRLVFL
jgi:hypothetical protein